MITSKFVIKHLPWLRYHLATGRCFFYIMNDFYLYSMALEYASVISRILINEPIINAKIVPVTATAAIVIIDLIGLLKPNNTIAPAIGVAMPVTPILDR